MGRAFLWLVCLRGFSALPVTTPSLFLPGDSCWAAEGRWQGAAGAGELDYGVGGGRSPPFSGLSSLLRDGP